MYSLATFVLLASSAFAAPLPRAAPPSAAQIAALAPPLGVSPPLPPTGSGDCIGPVVGANGKNISVPCACPPAQADYVAALVANVQAGKAIHNPSVAVTFPTGNTIADAQGRINAASVTLQNLNGPGQGCPFVSTTLGALSKQLQAAQAAGASVVPDADAPPATAAAPPAKATKTKESKTKSAKATAAAAPTSGAEGSSSASASGAPSAAQIAALAPPLGVSPPLPPTGSGDCIGPVVGANGKNISVPCACPPAQADYVAALVANVQAGKAIHNPSVAMTFPTGSSKADQQARINAAAVTLQNLNGPGQGCPFASTTLGALSKSIGN